MMITSLKDYTTISATPYFRYSDADDETEEMVLR